MVCCCDRKLCEWLLRIGNALAALLGLLLLGCGLYLMFGPVNASNNLLEFLKLEQVPQSYALLTRFPIVVVCIGAAIFLLSAITFCVTGTSCGKCYYCVYSPLLMILSIAIAFAVVVLYLASKTIEGSDYQEIKILGFNLTPQLELLWTKGVVDDTETMCELQEVVQCSGYYDDQCVVPPGGNFTVQDVVTGCPAQFVLANSTGAPQPPSAVTNATLEALGDQVGWDVEKCYYEEQKTLSFGCLRTFAEILYEVGNILFIPGLVIACYVFLLSAIASYLNCCTC